MTDPLTPWTFLKRARLRAGYGTARAAAEAIGVSHTHYCMAEKGRRGLSGDVLLVAARKFRVDVIELAESRPQMPTRNPQANGTAA